MSSLPNGRRSSRVLVDAERRRLAAEWRVRAARLDDYGRRLRRDGDPRGAEDAEDAALEYRIAADELELENPCPGHPSGPYDPMGETVYCDGSCVSTKPPEAA